MWKPRRISSALSRRHRELDRAAVDEPRGLAGLGLERPVEVLRVLRELGLGLGVAQRRQQSGGVPGRPAGELLALEQHDVAPAELGEVIGDRAADDAAADDDDTGAGGQGARPTGDRGAHGATAQAGCSASRASHSAGHAAPPQPAPATGANSQSLRVDSVTTLRLASRRDRAARPASAGAGAQRPSATATVCSAARGGHRRGAG